MHSTLSTFVRTVSLVGCALAAGCGSSNDNSLDDQDNVRLWATTASAVGVYSNAYGPIAFADGKETYDPTCPTTTDDGTTVTITGGCTDPSDNAWVGTATVVRSADGSRDLTLDGFGKYPASDNPASITGSVNLQSLGAAQYRFVADYVHRGGMTTDITYDGTIDGTYDAPTTWNGSGHVTRSGKLPPTGAIDATTVDEVVDDATCSGQPASGSTTIQRGPQTAVVTYDGATDCDASQNARWSVDGQDRGLIDGITCSLEGGVGQVTGSGAAAALAALALCAAGRRKGRPSVE